MNETSGQTPSNRRANVLDGKNKSTESKPSVEIFPPNHVSMSLAWKEFDDDDADVDDDDEVMQSVGTDKNICRQQPNCRILEFWSERWNGM